MRGRGVAKVKKQSAIITVETTGHAYGGETLGRSADGRLVFLPFALPAETVRARVVEEKRHYLRADLLEVIRPSPQRVQPRCPHYMSCGGCHYQHMAYDAQLQVKATLLAEQLERIGGLHSPRVQPTIASPLPWNYRNHVQFHVTNSGLLGYKAPRSQEVIPVKECHLPEPPLNDVWPLIEIEKLPGLRRLALRLGIEYPEMGSDDIANDVLLVLESDQPAPPELNVDIPISAVFLGPAGSVLLCGNEYIFVTLCERYFRVSAKSFFQINRLAAAAMVDYLLANLPLSRSVTLLDVYCGVGLFSAFLAPHVGRLVGIEAQEEACADFAVNLDDYDHVELYQAPAEWALPALNLKADIILVDPPRAGLSKAALEGILALQPDVLAYVSCDPATLGRDARHLNEAGYRLLEVTPFDLFPQTYHIESIALWKRDV